VIAVVACIAAFACVLMAGLLYVRLLHGPISVSFLTQPIQRAIAEEVAGVHVAIEGVDLRLADSGHVEFELKNVRVTDSGGVPLVIAPSASISLSRKALLSARIAPESVDLNSPRLSLFYSEDGTLALKFAPPVVPSESERAKLPSGRGAPETPPTPGAAGEVDGALGRIDLVKMLSETARARRAARQRLPARDRPSSRHRRHRPGRPPERLAPCPSSASISTTSAVAARSPVAPRSSPRPGLSPSTSAPTSTRPPRHAATSVPSRASCRAAWRGRCRRWRA
jgi:hypothetical protein